MPAKKCTLKFSGAKKKVHNIEECIPNEMFYCKVQLLHAEEGNSLEQCTFSSM